MPSVEPCERWTVVAYPYAKPVGAEVLAAQPRLAPVVGAEDERTAGEVDRSHGGSFGRDEAAAWAGS